MDREDWKRIHRSYMGWQANPQRRRKAPVPCNETGCTVNAIARGLCTKHYNRWKRHHWPVSCSFPECGRPMHARGLCSGHIFQADRGITLRPIQNQARKICSVQACDSPAVLYGFCSKHLYRWKTHGDPEKVIRAPKGSGATSKQGYRVLTINNRQVPEHRHLMEQSLGRILLRCESVHHKNGVRDDNNFDNLELWNSSHPPGQRVEDKVAWAVELLKLYAPEWLSGDLA